VFLDDRRSFANVVTLLTRLTPVSTVYVACTEGGAAAAAAAQAAPWHRCVGHRRVVLKFHEMELGADVAHRFDETRFRKLRWWKMGSIIHQAVDVVYSLFAHNKITTKKLV